MKWFSLAGQDGKQMSFPTDEQQQIQLELKGLKRTLEWTEIQREQLLDRLDLLRLENARLQDRVEELEHQVEGLKQQQPLF
jgi:predicted nuclease with TOPRIM domain